MNGANKSGSVFVFVFILVNACAKMSTCRDYRVFALKYPLFINFVSLLYKQSVFYAASLDLPAPLPISLLLPGTVTASGRFCKVNGVLSIVLPSFFQSLMCSRMIPAALSGVSCRPIHSTKSPSGSIT